MASERRTPASTRETGRESAGRPGIIRMKSQREARHIAGPPNRCATILRRATGAAQVQAFPSVCSAYVGGFVHSLGLGAGGGGGYRHQQGKQMNQVDMQTHGVRGATSQEAGATLRLTHHLWKRTAAPKKGDSWSPSGIFRRPLPGAMPLMRLAPWPLRRCSRQWILISKISGRFRRRPRQKKGEELINLLAIESAKVLFASTSTLLT